MNPYIKPANLLLLAAAAQLTAQAKESKPNVVMILADDIGYGDLSCYGATKVSTPNLDKLAKGGRIFLNMHSGSSVSTPSRYALMTGEYPLREKLTRPASYKTTCLIDENKLTLADVMQRSGYKTGVFGKWHLGFGTGEAPNWNGELKPGPLELGFDYYFGVPCVNSGPPFVYVENHHVVGYDAKDPFVLGIASKTKFYEDKTCKPLIGGADAAHALYIDEMVGTTLCEKSTAWIKENKKIPFFMLLSTTNIHHPFTPHPRFVGTSEAGIYGDFIHELDWIVGEVVKTLKEQKLDKNTIIIFTSDNGAMLNLGGQGAMDKGHKINGDLFGFKFDAWEGGHTVPMIVNYPKEVKAGTISTQLISNVDMLHTMASLVGYELKEGDAVDSKDMLPVLFGKTDKELRDNTIISANKLTHVAYREGDWVFIGARAGGGFVGKKHGLHNFGGYKAAEHYKKPNSDYANGVVLPTAPKVQLYNLKDDPYQTTNLAAKNPEKAAEMQKKLAAIKQGKATRY
ncbi:MAG: arylsulfatase [Rikenellaceae bacterium]